MRDYLWMVGNHFAKKGKTGVFKHSEEHIKNFKISIGEQEKHPNWKGNSVGYYGVHKWIEKWCGKPNKCEMCKTEIAKKYEWANISHTYKRILEDYIRMCTSCHRKYDIQTNNKTI